MYRFISAVKKNRCRRCSDTTPFIGHVKRGATNGRPLTSTTKSSEMAEHCKSLPSRHIGGAHTYIDRLAGEVEISRVSASPAPTNPIPKGLLFCQKPLSYGPRDSDGIQGGSEDRTESYDVYGEGGPELQTQEAAESCGPRAE